MRKDIEKAIEQIRNGQISEADARLQFSLIKKQAKCMIYV